MIQTFHLSCIPDELKFKFLGEVCPRNRGKGVLQEIVAMMITAAGGTVVVPAVCVDKTCMYSG